MSTEDEIPPPPTVLEYSFGGIYSITDLPGEESVPEMDSPRGYRHTMNVSPAQV